MNPPTSSPGPVMSGDALIEVLMRRVEEDLEVLVDRLVAWLLERVEGYQDGMVPVADLRRSVEDNLTYMAAALRDPEAVRNLSAPTETGRRRAGQAMPIPEILRAFRMGFTMLMQELVERLPPDAGPDTGRALVQASLRVLELNDEYALAVTESYRHTSAELLVSQQRRRAAILEAVLHGENLPQGGPYELARLLELVPSAELAVVVAESPGRGDEALPGIEQQLGTHEIRSVWRVTPVLQAGLVSLHSEQRDPLLTVLRERARGRVGVSPVFERLEDAPQAFDLARIAMASARPDGQRVVCIPAGPLAAFLASAPDAADRLAQAVLGPVLDLGAADRVSLITTLTSWFAHSGSAEATAGELFCHPNTVRYRLRRIQELTGRSVSDPNDVAELGTALHAMRMAGHNPETAP